MRSSGGRLSKHPAFLLSSSSGPLVSPSELDRLSNLHSLALDFPDFSSELCALLASPRRAPLHRLSLLLNGAALEFKSLESTAREDDWKALVTTPVFSRLSVSPESF